MGCRGVQGSAGECVMLVLEFLVYIKHTAVCIGTAVCITICCSLRGSPLRDTQRKPKRGTTPKWFYDPYLCNYQCGMGYFLDEISVSLDCCITGLWQPITKNYVFNMFYGDISALSSTPNHSSSFRSPILYIQ